MKIKEKKNVLRWNGIARFLAFALVFILPMYSLSADENQASDKNPSSNHLLQLEDLVVTAQKRPEQVHDVPVSMDVFSEFELEDAGITDMKSLTYFSPNLYSKQNTNQNMLIIRGISSHNVVLNTPVGLFVDEINYPMTFMQNPELFNVERVEILRGPQGTLYGKNTEAGAVIIVTRQPDNEPLGKVIAEIGRYDVSKEDPMFYRYGASYSGPLIQDRFYFGFAYQGRHSKGYTENIYNDDIEAGKISRQSGQATLRWTPGEAMDISLIMNNFESDDGYGYIRYIDGSSETDRYVINWDGANSWKDTNSGQALKIEYESDNYRILSLTTRNAFVTEFDNDGEFGPLDYGDQVWRFSNTAVSQELRLQSLEEQSSLDWLIGLYGFQDQNEIDAGFFGQERFTEYENRGTAIFGQMTYSPTSRLHLTGGLRYDQQTSEGEQEYNLGTNSYSETIEHSEWLPKGVVSFDFKKDLMGYVSVAKGILAGGFNYAFAVDSDTLTFDAEKTMNYEIGMKLGSSNQRLMLSVAVFKIDITNKQVQEWLTGPAARSITNAAEASSTGTELDFQFAATSHLKFSGGIGWSDARIEKWVSDEMSGGQYDYSGKKLPHSPEYTYNLATSFDFAENFNARIDINGVGSFYSDEKNEHKIDAYELVNLSVGYKGESLGVKLWADNIFDKEYYTSLSYYIGGRTAQDGEPRTIGITGSYIFQ